MYCGLTPVLLVSFKLHVRNRLKINLQKLEFVTVKIIRTAVNLSISGGGILY